MGKVAGKNERGREIHQLLHTNLEMSCYYGTKMFEFISKELNIDCSLATIRIVSLNRFHALFVIPFEKCKIKETRTKFFQVANESRKALKVKEVCLEISIIPNSEHLSEERIYQDGYFCYYSQANSGERSATIR